MLRFLLDTDHLTLLEHRHALVVQNVAKQPQGAVGLAVVTVEESLRGRLAAIAQASDGAARIARYALLVQSLLRFQQFSIVPFDQSAEDQYQLVRGMRLRFGTRDQKIAAIALANHLTLVKRNNRDFGQVPGLVLEDWSV